MKHTIEVNGIKVYTNHGCMEEEKAIGGHYIVDVSVVTNFSDSFHSDDLKDTVDYVAINTIVKEEMAIRSKLIEHVGQRMMQRMKKELDGVFSICIKVTKLSPPIDGDVQNVAIIIEENC
jgi:7,8-dihydroneopterin aldolase/epimerase/oxygenase